MTVSTILLPKGAMLARSVISLALGRGNRDKAREHAERTWRSTPAVAESFSMAAVGAATPHGAGWADDLVPGSLASDALLAIRAQEVLNRIPLVRRVPFNTNVPRSSIGFGAGFVGAGEAIAVTRTTLDTLMLPRASIKAVTIITAELQQDSPIAEETVRRLLIDAAAAASDEALIDPDLAPVANVHPGSVVYGSTEITSSGTNGAALNEDMPAMIEAVTTPKRGGVWIMTPGIYAKVLARLGYSVTPADVRLFGFPVLLTGAAPGATESPPSNAIVFLDGQFIALAEGTLRVDVSTASAIQMNDAPTQSAASGTGSATTSLFQTNSVCVRLVRDISFTRAVPGSVSFMRTSF